MSEQCYQGMAGDALMLPTLDYMIFPRETIASVQHMALERRHGLAHDLCLCFQNCNSAFHSIGKRNARCIAKFALCRTNIVGLCSAQDGGRVERQHWLFTRD